MCKGLRKRLPRLPGTGKPLPSIVSVKAAIWKNPTEKGDQFNVTVSRIYKDGEVWKSTNSFGKDDLLALAKVADKAHDWVCEQK
jgi:hypothetical protein